MNVLLAQSGTSRGAWTVYLCDNRTLIRRIRFLSEPEEPEKEPEKNSCRSERNRQFFHGQIQATHGRIRRKDISERSTICAEEYIWPRRILNCASW